LGDRRILMVVDDAWSEPDLRPFLRGGPGTTRLITTRLDNILPDNAVRQSLDAMQEHEAQALLAGGLPPEQVAALRAELVRLAARLGEWALLLKLVNAFLRDRVTKKQALERAIADVNMRLDSKGLVAFDARNETDRSKAVVRTYVRSALAWISWIKRDKPGSASLESFLKTPMFLSTSLRDFGPRPGGLTHAKPRISSTSLPTSPCSWVSISTGARCVYMTLYAISCGTRQARSGFLPDTSVC
jgi:hypothetical protein